MEFLAYLIPLSLFGIFLAWGMYDMAKLGGYNTMLAVFAGPVMVGQFALAALAFAPIYATFAALNYCFFPDFFHLTRRIMVCCIPICVISLPWTKPWVTERYDEFVAYMRLSPQEKYVRANKDKLRPALAKEADVLRAMGRHGPVGKVPPMLVVKIADDPVDSRVTVSNVTSRSFAVGLARARQDATKPQGWARCPLYVNTGQAKSVWPDNKKQYEKEIKSGGSQDFRLDERCADEFKTAALEYRVTGHVTWWSDSALAFGEAKDLLSHIEKSNDLARDTVLREQGEKATQALRAKETPEERVARIEYTERAQRWGEEQRRLKAEAAEQFRAWLGEMRRDNRHGPLGTVPPVLKIDREGDKLLVTNSSMQELIVSMSAIKRNPSIQDGWDRCPFLGPPEKSRASGKPFVSVAHAYMAPGETLVFEPMYSCLVESRAATMEFKVGRGPPDLGWWSDSALARSESEL